MPESLHKSRRNPCDSRFSPISKRFSLKYPVLSSVLLLPPRSLSAILMRYDIPNCTSIMNEMAGEVRGVPFLPNARSLEPPELARKPFPSLFASHVACDSVRQAAISDDMQRRERRYCPHLNASSFA